MVAMPSCPTTFRSGSRSNARPPGTRALRRLRQRPSGASTVTSAIPQPRLKGPARTGRRRRLRPHRCVWHIVLGIWYTTDQHGWQRSIGARARQSLTCIDAHERMPAATAVRPCLELVAIDRGSEPPAARCSANLAAGAFARGASDLVGGSEYRSPSCASPSDSSKPWLGQQ